MSDNKPNEMAGDLAEYIGEHLQHVAEGWQTTDDADEYVIAHVMRLDREGQRRMRAIATALLGLTASALFRAGHAPAAQEAHTDNPDAAIIQIEAVPPREYDRG